jgi:Zn-dependent peptidase ImmA (M78 family)
MIVQNIVKDILYGKGKLMKEIKAIIADSIEELKEDLRKGHTDRIKKYFEWKAKFHRYSFWNTILIYIQRPDAELVKGFVQWKNMGYHVNKGSKAIQIMAPQKTRYIYRINSEGNRVKVYWGHMSRAERGRTEDQYPAVFFRSVNVFDIKDTDCKEYPKFFISLGDSHREIYTALKEILSSKVKIGEAKNPRAEGYYNIIEKYIVIKQNDYNNRLLTLMHETAHWYCHNYIKDYNKKYSYIDGEIHAESVAFILGKFLGIDNPFSRDYIISYWKTSIDKIEDNLSVIDEVSTKLIDIIEKGNNETIKQTYAEKESQVPGRDTHILTPV